MKYTIKSKTHILGSIVGALGGVLLALPDFEKSIPPEAYKYIFMGLSFAIIILRNFTSTPIESKQSRSNQ